MGSSTKPTFPVLHSPGSTAELSEHEYNAPSGNASYSRLLMSGIDGDRPGPAYDGGETLATLGINTYVTILTYTAAWPDLRATAPGQEGS